MIPAQLQAAGTCLNGLVQTVANLEEGTKVLNRLEALVHVSRAARAPDVKVTDVVIKTNTLPGNIGEVVQITACTGDFGQYFTRITLSPKPGFRCSCPDLEKRQHACKHVAALAVVCRKRFWDLSDLLQGDIVKLKKEKDELEALCLALPLLTQNLASKTEEALTGALRTLQR